MVTSTEEFHEEFHETALDGRGQFVVFKVGTKVKAAENTFGRLFGSCTAIRLLDPSSSVPLPSFPTYVYHRIWGHFPHWRARQCVFAAHFTIQERAFSDSLFGRCAELRIGASGISWRSSNSEDGRIVNVPVHELKWVEWLRVARNFQLRVGLKGDRRREAFDGFLRQVCSGSLCSFRKMMYFYRKPNK